MIQRIQTLYMLAISGFMTALCFTPMVRYMADGTDGAFVASDFWWLGVLFALAALVPFVTIWLFKNRMLQVRLLCAEVVLLVGSEAFALWASLRVVKTVKAMGEVAVANMQTATFFPLVCVILTLLAIRGILKDERLVRSLDRIR